MTSVRWSIEYWSRDQWKPSFLNTQSALRSALRADDEVGIYMAVQAELARLGTTTGLFRLTHTESRYSFKIPVRP